MVIADSVPLAESGMQSAIRIDMLQSTLQVLEGLISSLIADKNRVISRWFQEGIACCRLDFIISYLLEFFSRFRFEHTVDEIIRHTLITLRPRAHESIRLFAEYVEATLQVLKNWLLRAIRALFKWHD